MGLNPLHVIGLADARAEDAAAYKRGTMLGKRRALMSALAQHCEGKTTGTAK